MSRIPREIEGSVVVVTGASSGIGRAAARLEGSLREAADECEAAGRRSPSAADVTDEEAVRELARRAVDRFGRIDTWVNNAGVMVYGRFEEVPAEVYRHVIDRRPRSIPGKANGVVSDHRE